MVPYAFGSSDGLFNLGSALSFVQALPHGVYIAMNGRCFPGTTSRRTASSASSRRCAGPPPSLALRRARSAAARRARCAAVLADRAVGGEAPHARDVEDGHARPALLVEPGARHLVLRVDVGAEVGEQEERVVVRAASRPAARKSAAVARASRSPSAMRSSTSRSSASLLVEVARPVAARRAAPSTSSAVRPNRKKFSAPTSSRISTFAPSSVPIVSAPFSENFMLPGARGLLARGRDLLGQVGAGEDPLAVRDVVVGQEGDAQPARDGRVARSRPRPRSGRA